MAEKYTKAPISELVLGVFLKSNFLLNNGIIFELIQKMLVDFSIINTHPAISIDSLTNNILIQSQVDYSRSGFTTYRLTSQDSKWQVILMQDMITLHWNRQDNESVGNYPGFQTAFEKFKGIHDTVIGLFQANNLDFKEHVDSYYLSYNDRVNLEEYKQRGLHISDIIDVSMPGFSYNNKTYLANNYWNRYSLPCDAINGYSLITINTPSVDLINQILIVENKLRGKDTNNNIEEWFSIAHDIQVSFFETIFKNETLQNWM
jgi:uncharacterized protein (TIGR04255 family)